MCPDQARRQGQTNVTLPYFSVIIKIMHSPEQPKEGSPEQIGERLLRIRREIGVHEAALHALREAEAILDKQMKELESKNSG